MIFFFFNFFFGNAFAENLLITAKNISLDKNDNTSIFEREVVVKTQNKTIKSDYAKYDKQNGYLVLEKNICGNSKYELSKFHSDNIFIF